MCEFDTARYVLDNFSEYGTIVLRIRQGVWMDYFSLEKSMTDRKIFITENDLNRLTELLSEAAATNCRDRKDLQSLSAELERAQVVDSREIPGNVVTMNTRLRFTDMEDKTSTEVTLVFPADSNIDDGKMSIFSPVGTALFGYAEGDVIEWAVPGGIRKMKIEKILYQPEAEGDIHL